MLRRRLSVEKIAVAFVGGNEVMTAGPHFGVVRAAAGAPASSRDARGADDGSAVGHMDAPAGSGASEGADADGHEQAAFRAEASRRRRQVQGYGGLLPHDREDDRGRGGGEV